jgi:ABC-2 type transport system ATP-binding protein
MKQKVAIISALIHAPKLMVLDEPFVGLDPKASFTLKALMRDMCAQGAAIFFSTHVLDVAEKLCNKVAIIKRGRIIAAGDMRELTEGHSLEQTFLEADGDE